MALTQLKTGAIADDAVTTDKLANAINTARDANTAKTTNATHTGDVTGSGALTIANDAVTAAKLADNAVVTASILDGEITTAKLADDVVTAAKLASDAVVTASILDGEITTAKLADSAVTGAKITNGTINADDKISNSSITTIKIANDAITGAKLGDDCVATANIGDGQVTAAKLAAGVGGKILQVVSVTKKGATTNSTGANSWWSYNNSTLRADITASNANNKFLILASITCTGNAVGVFVKLMDDGSDITEAIGDAAGSRRRATSGNNHVDSHSITSTPIMVQLTAGDTNQHRFHVAFAHTSGSTQTMCLNRSQNDGDNYDRPREISTITVLEIAA